MEQFIYIGDSTRVNVEFLGTVRLQLAMGHFFELHDMSYIPFIRRNLVSVSILDRAGYNFLFGYGKVRLYRDSILIGNRMLSGNLYKLDLVDIIDVSFSSSLNVVGFKHLR